MLSRSIGHRHRFLGGSVTGPWLVVHRRTFFSSLFGSTATRLTFTRAASRAVLAAGGTATVTAAYYAQKAQEWMLDIKDRLGDAVRGISNLPTKEAQKHEFPKKVHQESVNDDDFYGSGGGGRDDQFLNLTRQLISVRNTLKAVGKDSASKSLLPSIVVIGSQSSGKSSLLEALIGHEILPKGDNMVTKRPVEITLINCDRREQEYAEFPGRGIKRVLDFSKIKDIIAELNNSVSESDCISEEPIDIRIHSPNVPDLTLIDLPGYIALNNNKQPPALKEKIVSVCRKYIQAPNIILAVSSADVDLANSLALSESRRVDPSGARTIGAITKMDLVEPSRGRELLKNDSYYLELGYFGVVTKKPGSFAGTAPKASTDSYRKVQSEEQKFFRARSEEFGASAGRLGIPALRLALIRVLERNLSSSVLAVSDAVRREVEEIRYQFKVQFNDQLISPQAYTTEVLDAVKRKIRQLSIDFGRPVLREELQRELDLQVAHLCSEIYWTLRQRQAVGISRESVREYRENYSQESLSKAQALLTKSGIGRLCTTLVVEVIREAVDEALTKDVLRHHPDARKTLHELAESMLQSKVFSTIDQVENAMKPFKYAVEFNEPEWNTAIQSCMKNIREEKGRTASELEALQKTHGKRKLRNAAMQVMSFSAETPESVESRNQMGEKLWTAAENALSLQAKMKILDERLSAVQPFSIWTPWWYPVCTRANVQDEACLSERCPEPYLFLISQKLAHNAVLFIWIELLNEFFYQFPREIDNKLYYQLDRDGLEAFARENPTVGEHLNLQEKKIALETAMEKLNSIRNLMAIPHNQNR